MGNRCFSLGRYENVCKVGQCVSSVSYQPSSSVYHTFVLTLNAMHLRQRVNHVTCELVRSDVAMAMDVSNSFEYGILVYANIIDMLYAHGVCPFYRRFYGAAYNCSAADVAFMTTKAGGVHDIQQTFNFRLLESFHKERTQTVAQLLPSLVKNNKLYEVLFQVAVASYALECADTFHNGLTAQNVSVLLFEEPQMFHIQVEETPYYLRSVYKVIVHGFDDSCSLSLGMNEKLNSPGNTHPNQKNEGVFFKDFLTFVGSVYALLPTNKSRDQLLSTVTGGSPYNKYILKSVFQTSLQPDNTMSKGLLGETGAPLPFMWYVQFTMWSQLIANIAKPAAILSVSPLGYPVQYVVQKQMIRQLLHLDPSGGPVLPVLMEEGIRASKRTRFQEPQAPLPLSGSFQEALQKAAQAPSFVPVPPPASLTLTLPPPVVEPVVPLPFTPDTSLFSPFPEESFDESFLSPFFNLPEDFSDVSKYEE